MFNKLVLRIAALLIISTSMYADDFSWGGTWASVWSGFATGPYSAVDHTTGKTISIFCLDFNDEIAPPLDWKANVYSLNSANVTANAQFGGNYGHGITAAPFAFQGDPGVNGLGHSVSLSSSPDAYTRYLEAAWLFTNIRKAQAANDVNTAVISQVAAWELFVESQNTATLTQDIQSYNGHPSYTFGNYLYSKSGYASTPGTKIHPGLQFEDAVNEALKAAQDSVVVQNWDDSAFMPTWNLVTGTPNFATSLGRPVQEFLTDSVPPVPEPAAIVLLGTVLVGLGLARKRKAN